MSDLSHGYKSEITLFLEEMKRKNPNLDKEQREGRARLWDKPQDLQLQQDFAKARVPQKSYVYDVTMPFVTDKK